MIIGYHIDEHEKCRFLITNLSAKSKETTEFIECCAKINGGWLSTKTAREKELERKGRMCC